MSRLADSPVARYPLESRPLSNPIERIAQPRLKRRRVRDSHAQTDPVEVTTAGGLSVPPNDSATNEIASNLVSVAEWVLKWGNPEVDKELLKTIQRENMIELMTPPPEFDLRYHRLVTACKGFIASASAADCGLGSRGGHTLIAQKLLLRQEGIPLLRSLVLRDYPKPWHIPHAVSVRPTLNWDAQWTRQDDCLLLTGIVLHGFGNWDVMAADSTLHLADKIYLGSREQVPNELVLERRADYLLRLLVTQNDLAVITHSLQKPTSSSEYALSNYFQSEQVPAPSNVGTHVAGPSRRTDPEPETSSKPLDGPQTLVKRHDPVVAAVPMTPTPSKTSGTKRKRTQSSTTVIPQKVVPVRPIPGPAPTATNKVAQRKMPTPPQDIDIISRRWTEAAAATGAAPVTIVGEDVPGSWHDFRYLENSIDFGDLTEVQDVLTTLSEADIPSCRRFKSLQQHVGELVARNGCQADVGFSQGPGGILYDNEGHVLDIHIHDKDTGTHIECNKFCACPRRCPNRRSQWPREVPIEIFHTGAAGWGVRSPVRILSGRVLGFFTGKLMDRAQVQNSDTYIFDIGDDDEDSTQGAYSIDANTSGNWTRFANHSCDPNLVVRTVAVDYPLAYGVSRLVYVAARDIPPREELTIDYSPDSPPGPAPHGGRIPCKCRSLDICREWVFPRAKDDEDDSYEPPTDTDSQSPGGGYVRAGSVALKYRLRRSVRSRAGQEMA